ncbi:Hypothetical protein GLP15_2819 [Giardia lamblia P15]|uniref:Uncharacterized protein n=1 Tax=Giardia intestinalis (strain P15) TaxID=658858 RepID=E1F4B9_GIAIA|nr:Hypothetical protein GLP15_2819 [Giardia lamblia P15]
MSTGTGLGKLGNTYGTAFRPGPLLLSTARACDNASAPAWPFDPQRGLEQRIWGTPPASGSPIAAPVHQRGPQRTALLPLLRPRDRQGQSDHAAPGPDAECRRPPGPSSGPLAAPGERGIRPEALQTTGGAKVQSLPHDIATEGHEAERTPAPGRPPTPVYSLFHRGGVATCCLSNSHASHRHPGQAGPSRPCVCRDPESRSQRPKSEI